MKNTLSKVVASLATFLLPLASAHSDTFNINQTGDWSSSLSWTKTSGGGLQTVPDATDSIGVTGMAAARTISLEAGTKTILGMSIDNAFTLTFNSGATGTGIRTLSITGDLTKTGAGALRFLNANSNNLRLSIGGNLVIDGGSVQVGNSGAAANLLTVSGSTIVNNGSLEMRISGGTMANSPVTLGNLAVATSGTVRLQVDSGSIYNPQFFRITSLSGAGKITADVVNTYNATLLLDMANHSTFSGQLLQVGAGSVISLRKSGTATLTLSGQSDYTGTTDIYAGVISVGSIGSSSQAGNLGKSGAINLGNATTTGKLIYTGAGETTDRIVSLSGTTGGGIIQADGNGALQINHAIGVTFTGSKTLELTGGSLAENTIAGVISNFDGANTVGVQKSGTGQWVLSGQNTYSGATTVSEGTLVAGSDAAFGLSDVSVLAAGAAVVKQGYVVNTAFTLNGGHVVVNGGVSGNRAAIGFGAGGGVLAGNGSVDVSVGLNNVNQVLSPGERIGTLEFTKDQEWTAFTYDWKLTGWDDDEGLAGSVYSQIVVGGIVDLTGADKIVLSLGSFLDNGTASALGDFVEADRSWVIVAAAGVTGFESAVWSVDDSKFLNAFGGTWTVGSSGGDIILNYHAVPEPATWLLMAGGLGACVRLRGRRSPVK